MRTTTECPYCDGDAQLNNHIQNITYKKEAFDVYAHYYKCASCGEEFTTTQTDELTMTQVYNQYRERNSILFPQEIAQIRGMYDLSATSMSEVLGLGVNGFGLYEKGEMPTEANGNLILSAKNPWTFKEMLIGKKEKIPNSAYRKAMENVDKRIHEILDPKPFYEKIDVSKKPSAFTGYRIPDKDKVASMIGVFISRSNRLYNDRLKINKLLFYADFISYKLSGYAITGLSYRAIQYGPVPSCYDNIFTLLENEGAIYADWQPENGISRELFFTPAEPDLSILNDFEKRILDTVCDKFADTPSWELVELSHQEIGWIETNEKKDLIDYQKYAFRMRGVE